MDFKKVFTTYKYVYDEEKYKFLKQPPRNIDLKEVIKMIKNFKVCDVKTNKNYENQHLVLIKYNNYPVLVPIKIFEDKKEVVIKTAFQSRQFKHLIHNC